MINDSAFLWFIAGCVIGGSVVGWCLTLQCNRELETMLENRNRTIAILMEEIKR